MPRGERRRKHDAVRYRGRNLEGTFPGIMVAIRRQDTTTLLDSILGHEVNSTAYTRHAELCGNVSLVDLYLFHLVQVDGRKIHCSAACIVQRHAVHANHDVSRRDSTNRNRLKTSKPALLVGLDSGKSRKQIRRGESLALPRRRRNFRIADVVCTQVVRRIDHLRSPQILHKFFCGSKRSRKATHHHGYAATGQRRMRSFKEGRRSHLSSFNSFPQFF